MSTKYIQIMCLAAQADRKIDPEEKQLIETYMKLYPPIRDLGVDEIKNQFVILNTRLMAGMKTKHIVEDIGDDLTDKQKNIAYALAVEMCYCNFNVLPEEQDLLDIIESEWKIKNPVISALKKSAMLRYEKKDN